MDGRITAKASVCLLMSSLLVRFGSIPYFRPIVHRYYEPIFKGKTVMSMLAVIYQLCLNGTATLWTTMLDLFSKLTLLVVYLSD